jgi:hypothetical protein
MHAYTYIHLVRQVGGGGWRWEACARLLAEVVRRHARLPYRRLLDAHCPVRCPATHLDIHAHGPDPLGLPTPAPRRPGRRPRHATAGLCTPRTCTPAHPTARLCMCPSVRACVRACLCASLSLSLCMSTGVCFNACAPTVPESTVSQVVAYVRAVLRRLLPAALLGSPGNWRVLVRGMLCLWVCVRSVRSASLTVSVQQRQRCM